MLISCTSEEYNRNDNYDVENGADWYKSGIHYRTFVLKKPIYGQYYHSVNTVNITLDSLQVVKLKQELGATK